MSTTVTGLLIYSSILTQQWILHNNQDWWSIITSERSSLIFCTTVKSNFLKTSRRPLLNRREWNLFGKTQQTLRALKCGESNKQARLHVFTRTGTMRLCYMCLNAHCACVTCVYALCVFVLHVFTRTGTVRLCYMCLNVRCACVTCVYTYQTATPQQDTKGTTDGGRIFGSKLQGRFFLHLDTRVLQEWSLCQNNGCCSLLSSSYRSRPSRYATPQPPRD